MQTILGSGGAIGTPLAKELLQYTDKIRLVSRNPQRVNPGDELFVADLTKNDDVDKAVAGSQVVYLTVGLKYDIKIWKRDWPIVMKNTIDACKKHGARLVFLDNIYEYAPDQMQHMTEESRIGPASKKGKIRAEILAMVLNEVEKGNLTALIARSADFYGPDVKASPLGISVSDNYKKGKRAFWQSDASKVHSFTFTPDAAKATAILGNTEDAWNQTWHLPTSSQKFTGKDFIEKIAAEMNVKPRYYILTKTMISVLGLFIPMVKELHEMQYQYDRDYFFDSGKFSRRFSFEPTSYEKGIRIMVNGG